MRINKWFTENGVCSRREADRWISEGRISINGRVAVLGDQVQPCDVVGLDGNPVSPPEKNPTILAYNKPVGIECTSDPRVEDNIIQAVGYPDRVFHIGRLDKMSEGLILLTNLGDIVNRILRRQFHHEKEYIVWVDAPLRKSHIDLLRAGIDIGDDEGPTLPCQAEQLAARKVRLVLTEGRNRQIRRMMQALGLRVTRLKRVRVMNVKVEGIRSGSYRPLTPEETRDLLLQLDGLQSEGLQSERLGGHAVAEWDEGGTLNGDD